ncbi:MAG: transporter [Cyclobacteriaceae bacterium]|nr:transporter [Cyclobacteriaceae bacterium HetDA_MAG_MS6]
MKSLLVFFCSFLFLGCAQAQFQEMISSSRPGQAFVPSTAGLKVFQLQSGINYSEFSQGSLSDGHTWNQANLARFGISERFELRTTIAWNRDEFTESANRTSTFAGISQWTVGTRLNLLDSVNKQPSIGLQLDFGLDWVDPAYKENVINPTVTLLYAQPVFLGFLLTSNVWLSIGNDSATGYVLNFSRSIFSEKWNAFIESYGKLEDRTLEVRWDGGLAYLINSDLQLDVSAGFGRNSGLSDWFVDTGVSIRLHDRNEVTLQK